VLATPFLRAVVPKVAPFIIPTIHEVILESHVIISRWQVQVDVRIVTCTKLTIATQHAIATTGTPLGATIPTRVSGVPPCLDVVKQLRAQNSDVVDTEAFICRTLIDCGRPLQIHVASGMHDVTVRNSSPAQTSRVAPASTTSVGTRKAVTSVIKHHPIGRETSVFIVPTVHRVVVVVDVVQTRRKIQCFFLNITSPKSAVTANHSDATATRIVASGRVGESRKAARCIETIIDCLQFAIASGSPGAQGTVSSRVRSVTSLAREGIIGAMLGAGTARVAV